MPSQPTPPSAGVPAPFDGGPGASAHLLRLRVNGTDHAVHTHSWVTLLDLLRERLQLMGTKKGCDHGQCGACTVLVDGRRVNACLTLAVMQEGADVTTVEGLQALAGVQGDALHPLQQAFIDHDAFQCGYCTPGQLCSAVGLMTEGGLATEGDIRERMSGNLCRCGAYPQIVAAVAEVALGRQSPRSPAAPAAAPAATAPETAP